MGTMICFKEILGMFLFCVAFGPCYSEALRNEASSTVTLSCRVRHRVKSTVFLLGPYKLRITL